MTPEQEPMPAKATLEELKKGALEHYEEISTKAHHWSSFIPTAIEAYNPEAVEQYIKWLDEDINKGKDLLNNAESDEERNHIVSVVTALHDAKEQFLTIFKIKDNADKGGNS